MRHIILIAWAMISLSACAKDNSRNDLIMQNQLIGITSAHNARQLGGYHIGNKKIRKDVLIRTASLSSLSEEDSLLLADKFRVQCIYDFRGQDEIKSKPDEIPGDSRYMALSLSFNTEGSSSEMNPGNDMIALLLENADNPLVQDMCEHMYDKIFLDKSSQDVYRRFFADLVTLDPEDGAVLWHCTQGKDRAGSASAMLLSALGADRELIMADFKLSKEYYDPVVAKIPVENDVQLNVLNTLISANPVIFEKTLDKVDAEYGSLRNYLTECIGVTPEMMETLRKKYLQ